MLDNFRDGSSKFVAFCFFIRLYSIHCVFQRRIKSRHLDKNMDCDNKTRWNQPFLIYDGGMVSLSPLLYKHVPKDVTQLQEEANFLDLDIFISTMGTSVLSCSSSA